jgi:exopolysaccharide production protein ExoQ
MTTETYTNELAPGIGGNSRFLSLGLSVEEALNLPILAYFSFNGILNLPASIAKPIQAAATLWFGFALLWMVIRNRFQVHWELWTCRILALMTLEAVCSVLWSVQPPLTLVYPCVISILVFFYLNYLLSHFSPYRMARTMIWVLGAELAFSIAVSLTLPSVGIDSGKDDPSNAGAWQGIFAQKNQLGIATVLAVAVALGFRPRSKTDRIWRAAVILLAVLAAAGSRSREAWISIVVEIALALFLTVLRGCNLRLQRLLTITGMLFSSAALCLAYTHLDTLLARLGRSKTVSGRTYIWQGALLLIRRRPWLGYGVYGIWHTPTAWVVVSYAGWNVTSSHNNYLEILLYHGFVGLGLYLLLLSMFCVNTARAFATGRLPVAASGMLIVAGIIVLSFASPTTVYYPSAALLLLTVYCGQLEQKLAAN